MRWRKCKNLFFKTDLAKKAEEIVQFYEHTLMTKNNLIDYNVHSNTESVSNAETLFYLCNIYLNHIHYGVFTNVNKDTNTWSHGKNRKSLFGRQALTEKFREKLTYWHPF